jgi:hypothetical protein
MSDDNRRALEALAKAKALLPPEGPVVLSPEYLRLIDRVERLPQNRPGTDKSWTQRVLDEWAWIVKNAKRVPPG